MFGFELPTNQGVQFERKLFTEICKLLLIKKTHASPKDPLSDGMVESLNKTLATMLNSYVNKSKKQDWNGYLPFVLMVCSTV